jgi:hypothetical protein
MCRGYFYSQEIDPHHATEHRSTDQSRNGCGMCCFCHAQPFEITRAKNIKNTLAQRSCQNAKVVEAFGSRRVHHRDRPQRTIPIALAALPGAILPATSCIGAFRTPAPQRLDSLVMPASENLHMNRRGQLCDKFEGRGPSRPTRLFCSDVNALEARNFDSLLHSAGSLQSRRFCGFRVESAHPNSGIPKRQASIRADAAPRRQISIRSPWRYQRTTVSLE